MRAALPLVDATHGRAGPAPCLGGVGEVALVARYRRAGPNGIGVGDLAPYLAQVAQASQLEA